MTRDTMERNTFALDMAGLREMGRRIFAQADHSLASMPPFFLYGAAVHATGIHAFDLLDEWPVDEAAALLMAWRAT